MGNELSTASSEDALNNVNINVTGQTGGTVETANTAGFVSGGQGNKTLNMYNTFEIDRSRADTLMERTISSIEACNEGMVKTAALDQVLDKLKSGTSWLTIKGNPGEGKTTVGLMALDKLHNEGRQIFEVTSPEDFSEVIHDCHRPVIMLDDVLGSLEFDQAKWSKWDPVLRPFLKARDHKSQRQRKETSKKDVTIIFIGRSYVLNSVSVYLGRLSDIFTLEKHVVSMDHTMVRDIEEKRAIWRYMSDSSGVKLDTMTIENIITADVPHGFPHVCHLFTTIYNTNLEHIANSPEEFFIKPLEFLSESVKNLFEDANKVLLFKEMLKGEGKVSLQQLRKLDPTYQVNKEAQKIIGTYLKIDEEVLLFDHPAIYDSVAYNMCSLDPLFVIQQCHLSFIHERIRLDLAGNAQSPCSSKLNPFVKVPYLYADDLAQRFAAEIMSHKFVNVLSHQAFTDKMFVINVTSRIQTPLTRLIHLTDVDHSSWNNDTFLSLVPSSKSPELLKYIDNCPDIELTEEDENALLYGTCKYAASEVLVYLHDTRESININVRFSKWNNQTPLMISAKTKDKQFVYQILAYNPDLNSRDYRGRTALHFLCANGLVSVVTEMINSASDIDLEDDDGDSPLCYAGKYSQYKVAELLIERGAKVDKATLYSACTGGNSGIVDLLFDKEEKLSTRDVLTHVLSGAVQGRNIHIMNVLVDKGASVSSSGSQMPSLHAASIYNCLQALQWLLLRGFEIDSCDSTGNTALHRAAEWGSKECVDELLKKGATVDIKNEQGDTALLIAAELAYEEYMDMLLKRDAEVDVRNKQGNTVLHKAAEGGSKRCVHISLNAGVQKNIQNNEGDTALHVATERGSEYCVVMLLNAGVQMDEQNKEGDTALHKATKRGSEYCVDALLNAGVQMDKQNNEGDTALHVAADIGSGNCANLLLNVGAPLDIQNKEGDTPLHKAAMRGSYDCVDKLLKKGATVNIKDKEGNTALHKAASRGSLGCVELLLKASADVDAQNDEGETPLHKATKSGSKECIDVLQKAGARMNVTNKQGISALNLAAERGFKQCVETLLRGDPTMNLMYNKGNSDLHLAAWNGSIDCVDFLLKSGAEKNTQNNEDNTALHLATVRGSDGCVDLLLKAGAAVDVQNREGDTALLRAAGRGSIPCVDLLLKAGATVDIQNNEGNTALHLATLRGSSYCVKALLNKGAAVDKQNNEGNTALHLAARSGFEECAKFLLKLDIVLKPILRCPVCGLNHSIPSQMFYRNYVPFRFMYVSTRIGAEVNTQNREGNTPLHLLCSQYGVEDKIQFRHTFKRLIYSGACIDICNKQGTPALNGELKQDTADRQRFVIDI